MIELKAPVNPPYKYEALAHYISVWREVELGAPWIGTGFAACAPIHKQAVTSRQWDASTSVLDDELETNTARLISECMDILDAVERCLIMYGQCNMHSKWVESMEPERAQFRYELALARLAVLARKAGVDV